MNKPRGIICLGCKKEVPLSVSYPIIRASKETGIKYYVYFCKSCGEKENGDEIA